jgi:hypothetical protein
MPNSAATDIANYIITAGIGSTSASSTLPLVAVGFEPDVRNRTIITIYDVGGARDPEPKHQRDYPRIQVRTKAKEAFDYPSAYDAQQAVKDLLLGMDRRTIGGTLYVGCWQQGDINTFAPDYNGRSVLFAHYRFVREYTTPNRQPIA